VQPRVVTGRGYHVAMTCLRHCLVALRRRRWIDVAALP
jgi:hypothetical protein